MQLFAILTRDSHQALEYYFFMAFTHTHIVTLIRRMEKISLISNLKIRNFEMMPLDDKVFLKTLSGINSFNSSKNTEITKTAVLQHQRQTHETRHIASQRSSEGPTVLLNLSSPLKSTSLRSTDYCTTGNHRRDLCWPTFSNCEAKREKCDLKHWEKWRRDDD